MSSYRIASFLLLNVLSNDCNATVVSEAETCRNTCANAVPPMPIPLAQVQDTPTGRWAYGRRVDIACQAATSESLMLTADTRQRPWSKNGVYITYSDDLTITHPDLIALTPKLGYQDIMCVTPEQSSNYLRMGVCTALAPYIHVFSTRKRQNYFEGVIRNGGLETRYGQDGGYCWTLSGDFISNLPCGHFPNQSWRISKSECSPGNNWDIFDVLGRRVTVRHDFRLWAVWHDANFSTWGLHPEDSRPLGGRTSEFYIRAVAFTICHITFILYILTTFRPCMFVKNWMRSWKQSCRTARWWQRIILPADGRSKKVRELARRMRITRAHNALSVIMNFLVAPLLCLQIWLAWYDGSYTSQKSPRWGIYGPISLYCHELVPVAMLSPVILLFCKSVHFKSSRTLDFLWVLGSAVWICKYKTAARYCFQVNDILIMQIRLVFPIILGNAKLATLLQPIVTIAQIMIFAQDTLETNHTTEFDWSLFYYISRSLADLLLGLVLVWALEAATFREARAQVEAKESNQNSILVTKLLRSMCDTVVHLDKDLYIARPAPKLAAMLQRQVGTVAPLLGAKIQDFMDGESVTRYVEYIEEQMKIEEEIRAPIPINVTLYDSNRLQVSAQIVCACIPDTSSNAGDSTIVIGITEVGERQGDSIDVCPQLDMSNVHRELSDASSSSNIEVFERADPVLEFQITKEDIIFTKVSAAFERLSGQLSGDLTGVRGITLLEPNTSREKVFEALDEAWASARDGVLGIEFDISVRRSRTASKKRGRHTFKVCAEVDIPHTYDGEPLLVRVTSLKNKEKRHSLEHLKGTANNGQSRDSLPRRLEVDAKILGRIAL